MKKLFLLITVFLSLFLINNVYSGPICCGGPIGTGGIDASAPGPITIFQLDHNTEILTGDRILTTVDETVQFLDPGGASRNITLPAEVSSTDLVFTIYNNSDGVGEDLVIRDDTPTTLMTIGPEQGQRFSCDGTDWKAWFDNGFKYDGVNHSIEIILNDSKRGIFSTTQFIYGTAAIDSTTASNTVPSLLPSRYDNATGMGYAGADQPVIISGGIPSQVWGTVVTLSTAQVNALQAIPITIVAAQGANTWIELVTAIITYDYATAAFTVAADEDLVIEYGDGTDATASIETTGFLDQVDDEIRYYPFVLAAGADPEATINQVLRIKNTGAGEIANGGGEVDIRIVYRVYATGF